MPLGRQLSKLFNPGPAKGYNPDREALFAQLLSSGSGPTNDVGSAIGNLAKLFVGQRGLKKQGQARDIEMDQQAAMEADEQARNDQALAQTMADMGIEGDPGTLGRNPNLMAEAMRRSRPPAPTPAAKPEKAKLADGKTYWITGDKAGQQVVEGIEPPEPAGKMAELADGYTYWTTGPDKGKRVNPDVEDFPQRQAPRRW